MAEGAISGSIIQRTFIGADLPVSLFAASVPIEELWSGESSSIEDTAFRGLVAELFSLPRRAVLDETEYKSVADSLLRGRVPYLRRGALVAPGAGSFELNQTARDLKAELDADTGLRVFGEHAIALVASMSGMGSGWVRPVYSDRLVGYESSYWPREGDVDETALATAVACFDARLGRSRKMSAFTDAVLTYDLPMGHSPGTSSDSLLKLLDGGRKMCLAPLAAGGLAGITQLTQGAYAAAILTVGTGGVMTLILLGSVAVGSLLIEAVARRRGRG